MEMEIPEEWNDPNSPARRGGWLSIGPDDGHITVVDRFFAPDRKVDDKQRYLLCWHDNVGWWDLHTPEGTCLRSFQGQQRNMARLFDRLDRDIDLSAPERKIAVLLESPHKDEYDNELRPLGPARGATGRNFQKYFVSHVVPMLGLAGLDLRDAVYRIYLVNPVPYQASLRYLISSQGARRRLGDKLKNEVWKVLWNAGCQTDFVGRLMEYRPQIVLNGCTKDVKQLVTCALNSRGSEFGLEQHFNVSHPSDWQRALAPFKSGRAHL
ncbi:hypothetical protein ACN28S_31505 [Cystobacter fuscus]